MEYQLLLMYRGVNMVNEEKVRMMTSIALTETKYGKDEVKEGGYFRSDYIRFHITSAMWDITVAYFLVLFLIGLYHADYLLTNVASLPYGIGGGMILVIYVLFLVITGIGSYFYYTKEYIRRKKIVEEYCRQLEALEQYYQENEEETGDDTIISD